MSKFRIRSSFPIYNAEGVVEKTLFELYTDSPTNILSVYLEGKHSVDPNNEQDYIKKCLDAWHKEYFAEIEFANTTKKVDELNNVIEKTQKEDARRDNFIDAMVMHTIMSGAIVYGIVYKKLAGLLPKATVGTTYHANDIIVIEDPTHVETQGEGKFVFVQFNKEFTYNGEPVADFITKGRLEINGIGVAYPLGYGLTGR